jgi:hypothetical protein
VWLYDLPVAIRPELQLSSAAVTSWTAEWLLVQTTLVPAETLNSAGKAYETIDISFPAVAGGAVAAGGDVGAGGEVGWAAGGTSVAVGPGISPGCTVALGGAVALGCAVAAAVAGAAVASTTAVSAGVLVAVEAGDSEPPEQATESAIDAARTRLPGAFIS